MTGSLFQCSAGTPGGLPGIITLFVFACLAGSAAAAGADLKDFTSDGCSLFPDGTLKDRAKWCDCCLRHDIAYWRGGSEAVRRKADEALRDCVFERTGDDALAGTMFIGVRAGGHPAFPTWYRWGYGWGYGRGYTPLTDDEQRMVSERLEDYWKEHPGGYCRERHGAPEK